MEQFNSSKETHRARCRYLKGFIDEATKMRARFVSLQLHNKLAHIKATVTQKCFSLSSSACYELNSLLAPVSRTLNAKMLFAI
jgi:hypothetical protein